MIIKNLEFLKIHKLTQEQYEREESAGNLDEDAFYLVPDSGDFVSFPTGASVGQILRISKITNDGKPIALESASSGKWRYLTRIETPEDVQEMTITQDSEGNLLNLSRVIIQGFITPNNHGVDGYIKPKVNGKGWSIASKLVGILPGEGVIGRAFRYELEVVDNVILGRTPLDTQNTTSVATRLYTMNASGVDALPPFEGTSITSIGIMGWQEGVIGAGSYIDFWGVDA